MDLLGARPDRWWNARDGAMHRLVGELDRFAAATGEDVTVVFDRRPPDLAPGRPGSLGVACASRRGRNAPDHEIAELVAAAPEPGRLLVVTSDRQLAERVRDLGAVVEPSSRFRRRVDQALGIDPYRLGRGGRLWLYWEPR